VVISSNRADWIKFGIDTAAAKLRDLGAVTFDNVSDLRALDVADLHTECKNDVKRNASPPIYCPQRLGTPPPTATFTSSFICQNIVNIRMYWRIPASP
jgi:hypothetical protein